MQGTYTENYKTFREFKEDPWAKRLTWKNKLC